MIFTPDNAQKVYDGLKWQTRRLVKPGEWLYNPDNNPGNLPASVLRNFPPDAYGEACERQRLIWQVGRIYAIQPGRGKHAICRRLLLTIRQERLTDISHEDAVAEGVEDCIFPGSRLLYSELWNSIHHKLGTRWEDAPLVWALTFEQRVGV